MGILLGRTGSHLTPSRSILLKVNCMPDVTYFVRAHFPSGRRYTVSVSLLLPRLRRSPIKRSRMEIQSSIYPASDPRNRKIISRSDRLACSGQLLFPNKFHLAEGKHVFELVLLEFDLLECSMMKLCVCVCVCVCLYNFYCNEPYNVSSDLRYDKFTFTSTEKIYILY